MHLQDQYTMPEADTLETIKTLKIETASRIKDNQQTHLVFGYDHTSPLSEKVSLDHHTDFVFNLLLATILIL